MQFLVDIRVALPSDWTREQLSEMLSRETDAAVELMRRGTIIRIDRVVGRGGNVGIWQADSLEELDAALASMPLAPFLTLSVTPLTKHRVQLAYESTLRDQS